MQFDLRICAGLALGFRRRKAAMDAMNGKVLAEGKFDAIYVTNPAKGAKVPRK